MQEEAESQGVDGRRIVWAKWVSKSEHLLRHAHADLFLDTLTYGAHSTATDALAGGLPFLTLAGAIASRRAQVDKLPIIVFDFACGESQAPRLTAPVLGYVSFPINVILTINSWGRTNVMSLVEQKRAPFWGSRPSLFTLRPPPPRFWSQSHGRTFVRAPDHRAGASFASRVGVSLLRNAGPSQSALLVAGQREYEDLAVGLVSTEHGRKVLCELRASLLDYRRDLECSLAGREGKKAGAEGRRHVLPIFDTEAITTELNQAFMLMSDVHDMESHGHSGAPRQGDARLPHIVMTGRKANNLGLERDCKLEMHACV